MKPRLLLLGVLSLAALAASRGRCDPAPFSMPQSQVVRLGMDGFMDAYNKRTNNYSTQGQIYGYQYFERCKKADNDTRLKKLAAARRAQVASARSALGDLGAASWAMCSLSAGGGTMWTQMAAASDSRREEFLGTLIGVLALKPRRSPASRTQARAVMQKVADDLKYLQAQEKGVGHDGISSAPEARREYRQSWLTASTAAARVRTLIAALPDRAARLLASRTYDEVHNTIQENR